VEEAAEYPSIHSAAEKEGFSATGFPVYGILRNRASGIGHSRKLRFRCMGFSVIWGVHGHKKRRGVSPALS